MRGYFVTGTDTGVGKTIVTAALAAALRHAGEHVTIVKLVQTGVRDGEAGDAAIAGELVGVAHRELARFERPADPWSAALAAAAQPPSVAALCGELAGIGGTLVAEGSGGLAVPLRAGEHFGDFAAAARLDVVLAIGLRLGCINHALLTLSLCERLQLRVAAGVLVERWEPTPPEYRADVLRPLQGKLPIVGILPFAPSPERAVRAGAALFERFFKES